MKQLLLAVALFISLTSFGQDSTNFKVENNLLIWEKVYDLPGKSAKEIENMITAKLPSIPNTSGYFKSESNASLQFKNGQMDLKKWGGKWANTPPILQHPFTANVNTQWKDGKYKVIVSGLVGHVSGSDIFSNWEYETQFVRKGELTKNKNMIAGLLKADKWIGETFDLIATNKTDW